MAARPGAPSRQPAASSAAPAARRLRASTVFRAGGGLLVVLGLVAFLRNGGAAHPEFDKDRAFKDLSRQVEFGPRVPNTTSGANCRDFLVQTLRPLADSVERQDFTQGVRGRRLRMTNIIARWRGTGTGQPILLSAHWDTRPTADQEADPERKRRPIPGANDGASGVADLLELARVFKQKPPPVPVMVVFFDGEDYGPGVADMFLGSNYFAAHLPKDVPQRGVLLDMIGDRDLTLPAELNSVRNAGSVVDEVYDAARRLGLDSHFPRQNGLPVEDDHIPLQQRGLKVIDLIDFDYGPGNSWWHTLDDSPDKCSPTSLKIVGDVLLEWIYSQK